MAILTIKRAGLRFNTAQIRILVNALRIDNRKGIGENTLIQPTPQTLPHYSVKFVLHSLTRYLMRFPSLMGYQYVSELLDDLRNALVENASRNHSRHGGDAVMLSDGM